MIYYIADCHFFHEALNTRMDERGFAGAEEMNEYMIKRWNDKVRDTAFTPVHSEHESFIPCNLINCFCKRSDYEPLSLSEWIRLEENKKI
ncbi:MAG: hypothetical protein IJ695_09135 [Butyrivibrio sp.]|nr:hypothetical protein [Butyrivibrio sp.]